MESKELCLQFTHGVGDCIQFAHLLQLYQKRGYKCSVRYNEDKKFIFDMFNIPFCDNNTYIRHDWKHFPEFNHPSVESDGIGSKLFDSINEYPLPYIGEKEEIWQEICSTQIEYKTIYNDTIIKEVDNFLHDLPRPIILLHTQGNSFPQSKNLSKETTLELYKLLLQECDGTIILLDWDNRVPELEHCRIRHLKKDWKHISLEELYYLCLQADVLQGVDSGPYHMATTFTNTPVVGVFTQHYPSCVTLPCQNSFNIFPYDEKYKEISIKNRKKWNIEGYNNSAQEIGTHILRAIDGPRYLKNKQNIGRDLQLQHWIRDMLPLHSTGFTDYVDRYKTFDFLLQEITKRFIEPHIVETGCIRKKEDWSAGYSTYLFGAYLDGLQNGKLTSIDNNQEHCIIAAKHIEPWRDYIDIQCQDSVKWLLGSNQQIDVLYLDSMDTSDIDVQKHRLDEIQSSERLLHNNSIIVFDDTSWGHGWIGSGADAVPYLLNIGWKIISSGYQVILSNVK